MAIASLCDHAIMTVGTYGWWAAWFANSISYFINHYPTDQWKMQSHTMTFICTNIIQTSAQAIHGKYCECHSRCDNGMLLYSLFHYCNV